MSGEETPQGSEAAPSGSDATPSSKAARSTTWRRIEAAMRRTSITTRLALVFGYLFVWGSNWGLANWRLAGSRSLAVLTIVCGVWWLGRPKPTAHGQAASEWKKTPLSGWEVLWGLLLLATTLMNLDRWTNVRVGLWFMGMSTLLFVLVHDALSNGRMRLGQLSDGLLLGAFVPLSWGVVESLQTGSRAAGFIENANLYGGMAAWIIPIAFSRGAGRPPGSRWPSALVGLVAAVGLFRSGSRGAMLGLIGGSAVIVPLRPLVVGLAVLAPVIAIAITARWTSVVGRLPIYEAAIAGIRERPWFGHGLFTFRYQDGVLFQFQSHNIVLQIAYDVGLLGLGLAIAQAARFAQTIALNDAPERNGWRAALLATSLHQLVDVTWMSPGMLAMLPVLLAGTTASIAAAPRRDPRAATWLYGILTLTLLGTGWMAGNVSPDFFERPR